MSLLSQKLKYISHLGHLARLHFANCIRMSEYFSRNIGD